jgi:hypothetical protein
VQSVGDARPDPTDRPALAAEPLLVAFARRRVRWVLAGSAVLAGYGAAWQPQDLDVVPALDPVNLARVGEALNDLRAVPLYGTGAGGAPDLSTCRAWRAPRGLVRPDDVDLLFVTPYGLLDVVVRLCGDYADLARGATWRPVGHRQIPVLVADPAAVLASLPARRRDGRHRVKDVQRLTELQRMRSLLAAEALRWNPEALPG